MPSYKGDISWTNFFTREWFKQSQRAEKKV